MKEGAEMQPQLFSSTLVVHRWTDSGGEAAPAAAEASAGCNGAADGQTVRDAASADAFPIEIPLTTGLDGGWLLLYPDSGDSFASENAAGGSWFITAIDGADLRGCFTAEVSDEDRTFTVDDAILDVPQTST